MSREYQVIHKKSNVLTNGQPKLPSASTIEYGEIAINYAKGGETMSIKNANNEIVTFSSDAKIIGQIPSVADYFDGAEYDSNSKRINFKHGNTVKAYVDASDFIKDGMIDTVAITAPTGGTNSGITCLVVTFNTDAGKEDIEIPISQIFNASNYYTKTDADAKFLDLTAYTEDEEVIAEALNDLNNRIEQANDNIPHYTSSLNNDSGFITSAYTGFSTTAHTHSQYSTTAHTHTAAEVGAMATSERSNYLATGTTLDNVGDGITRKLSNYSTTGHTHSQYATTAHTHTAAEVGAMATSERSNYLATGTTLDNVADGSTRKLSNYATTGHSHTAAEVGAMATSERSNYLATGTTLDNVADGTTRKLSNYSTTGHTHSQYATTAHTHTASEVGAMATSERSNYSTTAHTHTASEVGAMATSERSNYLATGTTLDNVGDGTTRKLSNYATTGHSHTAAEVGAMATSERSNYLATGTTLDSVGDGTTRKLSNYSTTGHTHSQYLSGVTFNGTAATISDGVAAITAPALPSVSSTDNGKVLMVVNGQWAAATPTVIYTGSNAPDNSLGNDGDIYLQTS